ncbi:hypothetical protein Tco_1042760 [Tanacetum coccineum]|uniref:Uncharacterized protein n=1 Tax=Tanacetum coccineum TaxID=301880 RepID=A0ABQ5GLC6_9ASTR
MMTSKLLSLIGIRSISKVPGLMTHLVASLTLDSASRGGSMSPDSFLPSILLVVVIVVMAVVSVVVVVAVGGVPSILKLSFMVIGFLYIRTMLLVHASVNHLGLCWQLLPELPVMLSDN